MTKHNHTKHEHCEHAEVAYCGHCEVVYCKGCQREWGDCKLTHWPYTYIYPYCGVGETASDITLDNITPTVTSDLEACSHF